MLRVKTLRSAALQSISQLCVNRGIRYPAVSQCNILVLLARNFENL